MEAVVWKLAAVALGSSVVWFRYRKFGGRRESPLWLAFSLTTLAAISIIAGTVGFTLEKRSQFFATSAWMDHVIWPQIWFGVGVLLISSFFWRHGLRAIRSVPAPRVPAPVVTVERLPDLDPIDHHAQEPIVRRSQHLPRLPDRRR